MFRRNFESMKRRAANRKDVSEGKENNRISIEQKEHLNQITNGEERPPTGSRSSLIPTMATAEELSRPSTACTTTRCSGDQLFRLSRQGDLESLRALIKDGVSMIATRGQDGLQPAALNLSESMTMVVNSPASKPKDATAVMGAAMGGHSNVLQFLIENNAGVFF